MPGPPQVFQVAEAMPKLRLETVSFFLVLFLLSALFIQLLWNYLRRDWAFLPRLGYLSAVGLVTLWGLLFVLVLNMISGAREMMTPAAWEKQGATYRLADKAAYRLPDSEREARLLQARRERLEELRKVLWAYSRTHKGNFPSPADRFDTGIPTELWTVPDPAGASFIYVGGRRSHERLPILYEPEVFGPQRFVLYANGDIDRVSLDEILKRNSGTK